MHGAKAGLKADELIRILADEAEEDGVIAPQATADIQDELPALGILQEAQTVADEQGDTEDEQTQAEYIAEREAERKLDELRWEQYNTRTEWPTKQ